VAIYVGPRPVLPQQDSTEFVHPLRGVGNYTNYALYSTTHLFDGAPLEDHEPGDGRHPGNITLSRWYRGLDPAGEPMEDPGEGTRLENHRYRPTMYRGLAEVFHDNFGHPDRVTSYSLYERWSFKGVPEADPLETDELGHPVRGVDGEGTANSFGRFNPMNYGARAAMPTPMEDPGQPLPEGYDNPYGHNKVKEWQGISKAIF